MTRNNHSILTAAHDAARAAIASHPYASYPDADLGACGFAWVTIDGRDPLAAWCRAQKCAAGKAKDLSDRVYGHSDNPGWSFWKPGAYVGQAVAVHEIGARAFANELARHGIRAIVSSVLD